MRQKTETSDVKINRMAIEGRVFVGVTIALLSGLVPARAQESLAAEGEAEVTSTSPVDASMEAYRLELLDIAFAAASKFPHNPHIKNRSRDQEKVVAACLALDQPQRALAYIEQIDNWRRGAGHADYAFWCAQNDQAEEAERHLELAGRVAETSAEELGQAWRKERILVRIAQTRVLLGQDERAAAIEAKLEEASEMGKVDAVKAAHQSTEHFEAQLAALEQAALAGNLDQVKNALLAAGELYGAVFEDAERREQVEAAVRETLRKAPVQVAIETLEDLARSAISHAAPKQALELIEEAQALLDGQRWPPRHQIPRMAELAALRHGAGEAVAARQQADEALALFLKERENIVDIWRAGTLRPLAEAYHALGVRETALEIYRMAVEAGSLNPNSRPRADDLVDTCLSLALHGLEPDETLLGRLRKVEQGLGDPW